MKLARLLLLALLAVIPLSARSQSSSWAKVETPGVRYTFAASGTAFTLPGATLTLHSDSAPPKAFGSVSSHVAADSFRMRRVRIIADIDTKDLSGGASPWIRVDGPTGAVAFNNGDTARVRGTSSEHRELSVFVPASAVQLYFGFLALGSGEATARGLHLVVGPVLDATAPLPAPAARELDSAIAIVRANSLWKDTVTWSKVVPEVRARAAGSETAADVYPAIGILVWRLGDHHSSFMAPARFRQLLAGGAENPRPVVKTLSAAIGYISVPAYSGSDRDAMVDYTKGTQAQLAATLPSTSCKWVVDVRGNGGGNMQPMLGGLHPFLGDAALGSFVSGQRAAPFWRANTFGLSLAPELAALDSAYVAVLTGPHTASSGEVVTISFRGRPRTRSFGLPTAGLSTANQAFTLPDGAAINLTVSADADRTGRRYGERVDPDEVVPAGAPNGDDPQLAAAIEWLKTQPKCSR